MPSLSAWRARSAESCSITSSSSARNIFDASSPSACVSTTTPARTKLSRTRTPSRLARLQQAMDEFYSRPEARQAYQEFIDKREAECFDHPFERLLASYLVGVQPGAVLEIGCGSGRLFRTLRRAGFAGRYVGME